MASCVTALDLHGVWVPPHTKKVHARACEGRHRAKKKNSYCRRFGPPIPEGPAVDTVADSLAHALRCLDDEGIIVVCDSILNKALLDMCELERIFAAAPRRVRRLLARCDRKSQSGTESILRIRVRAKGIRVRSQVEIPGLGQVDLLIGNRLIIELDSKEFHDLSPEQQEKDRVRDEIAARLGYERVRFSYARIMYQWDEVEETIDTLIRRRAHLKALPPVKSLEVESLEVEDVDVESFDGENLGVNDFDDGNLDPASVAETPGGHN